MWGARKSHKHTAVQTFLQGELERLRIDPASVSWLQAKKKKHRYDRTKEARRDKPEMMEADSSLTPRQPVQPGCHSMPDYRQLTCLLSMGCFTCHRTKLDDLWPRQEQPEGIRSWIGADKETIYKELRLFLILSKWFTQGIMGQSLYFLLHLSHSPVIF